MKAAILLLFLFALPAIAEDWVTTDGKTYKDVKVLKVEPDAVTILDSDGGGLVLLDKLPPALQKRFNYDPTKAKAAAQARANADSQNEVAMEQERETAVAEKQAALNAQASSDAQAKTQQNVADLATAKQKRLADIDAQIAYLQADLEDKQRLSHGPSSNYSTGSYAQDARNDRAQIAALKDERTALQKK